MAVGSSEAGSPAVDSPAAGSPAVAVGSSEAGSLVEGSTAAGTPAEVEEGIPAEDSLNCTVTFSCVSTKNVWWSSNCVLT